jgi:hypothetical protein
MRHNKKLILMVSLLVGFILFLSRCINQSEAANDPRGKIYAGAGSCRKCHQAIYDSFLNTAHFKTTSLGSPENILGNFSAGHNVFRYDSTTKVVMEKRDSGYYQVLYENGSERAAYRFDILFGYRNAQTSVYWNNDQLFELPLSHYNSADAWATSPGFPADRPIFTRLIDTDCFDCHSSNINIKTNASLSTDPLLDRQSLIHGIDCERCHGPAINHVNYHLANPTVTVAAYLVKTSELSRQQKLDACAVCHSGNDKMKIQSRFQFKMGDTLGYFFMPFAGGKKEADVHGNQYSLLLQSKCFSGRTMTCGTCHDPHKNASESLASWSQKCMNCHKQESNNFCPQYASLGESIKNNCIDCHMPEKPSKAIRFQVEGSEVQSAYLLRTHRIAVYKDSLLNVHDGQPRELKNKP